MRLLTLLLVVTIWAGTVVAAPPPARAAGIDLPAVDAAIAAQMEKHGLKGVALAITQGEEVLYLKGYGTAGGGRPMTPQTPMFIGSQSKSFTALAIAQLADKGLVDVDAPVRAYIPWFAVADEAASTQITIAQLLHHTSGLSDAGFLRVLPESTSLEEGVRALESAKLTAPVGARFQYFNMGYSVLAYVVEVVSGRSYEEYIRQEVFRPLQMSRSYTDPALAAQGGLSQGYTRFFGFAVPARQPSPVYELAAGYLISTAEDLAHLAIAMSNRGVYEGSRVLSEAWMRRLFAPVQGYGMGWFVASDHIYHGGANETFKTFVDLYPQRDLGIVLLINQGYMLDHFISATQVFRGVEAAVVGGEPPAGGWSVKVIGWGLLALVLALCALQAWNIYRLRSWRERAAGWRPVRRVWDTALSFVIPIAILVVVFSQVKGFFGDRFNLTYQLVVMFRTLTDISILMVVGSVPDLAQGLIKLFWLVTGRVRPAVPVRLSSISE